MKPKKTEKTTIVPKKPLENVTNQTTPTITHATNCCVKVQKLGKTMTDCAENKTEVRRKGRSRNCDVSPSKNVIKDVSNLSNDHSIEKTDKLLKRKGRARNSDVSPPKMVTKETSNPSNDHSMEKTTKQLKRKSIARKSDVSPPKKVIKDASNLSNDHSMEKTAKQFNVLQKTISNKYVTVVDRLKLDFVPLCAENIEHCHGKHYKNAPPPKLASASQMSMLRNALQQSRHNIFINLVLDLCRNEHFPGDVVLSNIVQLLLTLNPESKFDAHLQPIIDQLLWLFDVILRTFPPCWLAIRPIYMNFLRNTIQMSKLLPDKSLTAQNTIFEVVIMLLEDTIDNRESSKVKRKTKKNGPDNDLANSLTLFDDEYHNMQHWERMDSEQQMFSALSKEARLNRLMQVLHLIAKMLEMDLAMWMLRYHKKPKTHIYTENQPLVITLFSLSQNTRSPVLVKKVMTLFALCVEKDLDPHYLQVMERFISLLANVQNLYEIETTNGGITYPHIGPATTSFTMDLFKTAEVHMKRDVSVYLRLIRTLRCPFVRYEYIDIFLKRLNPSVGKMCPAKIVENFRKKRWFECEQADGTSLETSRSSKQSIVYRNDYLQLLLEALRSYCDFHGTKEYLQAVRASESEEVSKASTDRKRIALNPSTVDLKKMMKKIDKLEAKADKTVKLREPRTEIPTVEILVNSELYSQYYNDMKHVLILHTFIQALQSEHDDDFSELMEFLNQFVP